MVGCLGKLKESIDNFHGTYLQPGVKKDEIFNPKTPFNGNTLLLLSYDAPSADESESCASKDIYRCSKASAHCYDCGGGGSGCRSNATLYPNTACPKCSGSMNVKMAAIVPKVQATAAAEESPGKKQKRGYVKEVVTYMVMDELEVKPMSTISSITLINKFAVNDLTHLEEKTVSFGKDEGLKLLKASLTTDKVLTTIFLH